MMDGAPLLSELEEAKHCGGLVTDILKGEGSDSSERCLVIEEVFFTSSGIRPIKLVAGDGYVSRPGT